MKRTILFGDLHGCYDEAMELLEKLAITSEDRVIFLGDLIDRGPKRWECVELARKHDCILGNHEEKHLFYRKHPHVEMSEDHAKTWKELTDEQLDYFASLPLYLRLPEYNAVAVHAGVLPDIPIEYQPEHTLLHCQNIKPPGAKSYWPSKCPEDYKFWTNYWKGPERVIFGHSVLEKPLISEFAVGIDTGCCFGFSLTALILPDWKVVSVPARKTYYSSRRRSGIAQYPVMNGIKCYS